MSLYEEALDLTVRLRERRMALAREIVRVRRVESRAIHRVERRADAIAATTAGAFERVRQIVEASPQAFREALTEAEYEASVEAERLAGHIAREDWRTYPAWTEAQRERPWTDARRDG